MSDFSGFGKALVIMGIAITLAGLFVMYYNKIPLLGKLPGDIHIKWKNGAFYFPIMTCILASIALSLLMYLFRKFF